MIARFVENNRKLWQAIRMANICIIHGAFGSPQENWFPWLATQLQEPGHTVIAPQFPIGEDQSLTNWLRTMDPYMSLLNRDSIIVGHSIAPVFVCAVLERAPQPIHAAFFVSGFLRLLNIEIFDTVNKSFIEHTFDWQTVRRNCNTFFAYHGSNDPYVPVEMGRELASNVGAELQIIKDAGHFNTASGYNTFPKLLSDIYSVID